MRVAILCNGEDLARWQRRAVAAIARDHQLFLLACGHEPRPKRSVGHAAYYALNLFTIRNRQTRRVPFPSDDFPISKRFDTRPTFAGAWAELPDDAIGWLKNHRIDAIVKFGLGLLRVPDSSRLQIPILSFHHGDPRAYRGRPAGFWELADGAPFVGQVVQILSNRLDAGQVVAFAETRAFPHSYRQTLSEAYALSPHLLPAALRAAERGETIAMEPNGRNRRLPGNLTVIRFILARWAALVRWLLYGAFIEKQWNVAAVPLPTAADPISAMIAVETQPWSVPRLAKPFCFYADPFFEPGTDEIIIEALHGWSGKGELVRLRGDLVEPLERIGGHTSYPAGVSEDGQHYLVPETSEWSPAGIYKLEGNRLSRLADLDIAERRLIDPTLHRLDGRLYLFANTVEDGVNVLHLWTSQSLFDHFERHPLSPVRLSVRGSRMAGQITRWGNSLYRLGQDSRKAYGDGLLAFKITQLSASAYAEEPAGSIAFGKVYGPHTVNASAERLVFDFYRHRFSLLAGVRRLAAKL